MGGGNANGAKKDFFRVFPHFSATMLYASSNYEINEFSGYFRPPFLHYYRPNYYFFSILLAERRKVGFYRELSGNPNFLI